MTHHSQILISIWNAVKTSAEILKILQRNNLILIPIEVFSRTKATLKRYNDMKDDTPLHNLLKSQFGVLAMSNKKTMILKDVPDTPDKRILLFLSSISGISFNIMVSSDSSMPYATVSSAI